MEDLEDFFTNYADMILGTFRAVCRTLPQLISVARLALPKYLDPVEKGQIEASNSRSLYRHVESFLKECLVTANLKESSSNSHQAELVSSQSSRLSVELPFVSKYLLIAAYLASYNPVSSGVTPLFLPALIKMVIVSFHFFRWRLSLVLSP